MGRLRVTEKGGEINNGREEGGGGRGKEESKGQEGREREEEAGEGSSRIVCLWRDVQLVEDYYLSNRREEEKRAVEEGRGEEGEGRGRHHVVNHGPVAPMYYIFPARGGRRGHGGRAMYMLLHCGAQCSIISPSIPSALIEERVPRNRAAARGGISPVRRRRSARGRVWDRW